MNAKKAWRVTPIQRGRRSYASGPAVHQQAASSAACEREEVVQIQAGPGVDAEQVARLAGGFAVGVGVAPAVEEGERRDDVGEEGQEAGRPQGAGRAAVRRRREAQGERGGVEHKRHPHRPTREQFAA